MLPEVLPLRHASRELVRELGFLQDRDAASNLSHSHCHALIEIDAGGELAQSALGALLRLDKSTTSRIVSELESRGWVRARVAEEDRRARVLGLTAKGKSKLAIVHREANARVEHALRLLDANDRSAVVAGMQIYARALERTRRRANYRIRPVAPQDRVAVARLIRSVMPEFGARGAGFAIMDAEVDDMFGAYQGKGAGYWVIVKGEGRGAPETVVGGGGFAALVGGDGATCELRKMYLYPELRGLGLGQDLLTLAIEGAKRAGYSRMYLETLASMDRAQRLYARAGFKPLRGPLGNTGHHGCGLFFALDLGSTTDSRRHEAGAAAKKRATGGARKRNRPKAAR